MEKTYCIKLLGKVQGVGMRNHIYAFALRENLCGKVNNESDGSVNIYISIDDEKISDFIKYIEKGTRYSNVSCIKIDEIKNIELSEFSVVY